MRPSDKLVSEVIKFALLVNISDSQKGLTLKIKSTFEPILVFFPVLGLN